MFLSDTNTWTFQQFIIIELLTFFKTTEKVRQQTVQCSLEALSSLFPATCFLFPIPVYIFAAFS